jgi:hypothetical protein
VNYTLLIAKIIPVIEQIKGSPAAAAEIQVIITAVQESIERSGILSRLWQLIINTLRGVTEKAADNDKVRAIVASTTPDNKIRGDVTMSAWTNFRNSLESAFEQIGQTAGAQAQTTVEDALAQVLIAQLTAAATTTATPVTTEAK